VVLVGYDLAQEFWIAKNSWGPKFADNGFFRISFDANVGVCNPSDTYGLRFYPIYPPAQPKLLWPPKGSSACPTYTARSSDYVSKVASMFQMEPEQVLLQNSDKIKSPDMFLGGLKLTLCGATEPEAKPKPQPKVVPSQAEALIGIRAMIDPMQKLSKKWSIELYKQYCEWPGVECNQLGLVTGLRPEGELRGSLPDVAFLLKLPELTTVNFGGCGLTGPLPPQWSRLGKLQYLYLFDNKLQASLPAEWSGMGGLTEISLARNFAHDASKPWGGLPDSWGSLKKLQKLDLTQIGVRGTLPSSWSGMVSLREAYLTQYCGNGLVTPCPTELSGALPSSWGLLRNLRVLHLGYNHFTGTLPAGWSGMAALRELGIDRNALTGKLPAEWKAWGKNLQRLYINGNQLSGPLPEPWSAFTGLIGFDASGNKLAGTLPVAFSSWKSLKRLWLYSNGFTGTLPAAWGSLPSVLNLNVSYCKLSGPLPASWSSLKGIQKLGLGFNSFSGTVPQSWSKFSGLREVELKGNAGLKGCIPAPWKRSLVHKQQQQPSVAVGTPRRGGGGIQYEAGAVGPDLTGTQITGFCKP
jgi:hypothetical protein